jgi:hypothetical protein
MEKEKHNRTSVVFIVSIFSAVLFAQPSWPNSPRPSTQKSRIISIPSGTILPLRLDTTLSSSKSRPGQAIKARIMQDVPLPDGNKLREGSKVMGHVVSVTNTQGARPAISVQFDELISSHETVKLTTDLRAIASLGEVMDAETPKAGEGEGDVWNWRDRTQIGGDVVYGVGGPVTTENAEDVVGTGLDSGVLSDVRAKSGTKCRGKMGENQNRQALWVFSSDSCGAYGLPHLMIAHAGRSNPEGVIILGSYGREVVVSRGAAMLLRVAGPANSCCLVTTQVDE